MNLIRIKDRQENDVEVFDLDNLPREAFSEHGNKCVIIRDDQVSFIVIDSDGISMIDSTDIYTESAVKEFLSED